VRCMTCRTISACPDASALLDALGAEIVKRKAGEGDREAQYSQGIQLMCEDGVAGALLGAAGRSPKADAGLARCTAHSFRSLTIPRCVV